MDNKKTLTFSLLLIIVIILGLIVWGSKNKKINSSPQVKIAQSNIPIFFYGNTCPHCADVEEWMKESNVEEKVKIVKKEIYDNQENAKELTRIAEKCGLPTDSIGVPFLFAEGKCLIGTPDIISYLSLKAKIKENK